MSVYSVDTGWLTNLNKQLKQLKQNGQPGFKKKHYNHNNKTLKGPHNLY